MRTEDFFYDLPEELIAQTPLEPRDSSRMMVCHRNSCQIEHRVFRDIIDYLSPGDALVINETRVLPARLIGHREGTGGAMEMLLLHRVALDQWEVLVKPGRRAVEGSVFLFGDGLLRARVLSRTESGGRIVAFEYEGVFEALLEQLGQMPLPPYIHEQLENAARYQTVYAAHNGSAAAPTAGLHFTPGLLAALKDKGIEIIPVLLHVGLGTFRPVKVRDVNAHVMHSEYYEVSETAAAQIRAVRARGNRVVCVGTTSVRTLETVADEHGQVQAGSGWTQIFITPGTPIRAADALITNFHLPESTLLMLISAFWSREAVLDAYRQAVEAQYRFFSFGDCMLLL